MSRCDRGLSEQHAGEHGRQEGAGHTAAAELLEHDRELERAVPRTAERFGNVQSGPAEPTELGPKLGRAFARPVDGGAHHVGGDDRFDEAADHRGQRLVLGGDPDRHVPMVPRS